MKFVGPLMYDIAGCNCIWFRGKEKFKVVGLRLVFLPVVAEFQVGFAI